jgi:hypothetical protein
MIPRQLEQAFNFDKLPRQRVAKPSGWLELATGVRRCHSFLIESRWQMHVSLLTLISKIFHSN